MHKKANFILSSLLAVILLPTKVFAEDSKLQEVGFRLYGDYSPVPSRRFTWLGGRDVTLRWKLPSPEA